ncbi:hypothetical protein, partial [Kitasatospora sp. NPDC085464]|uniref:hypothetical protein n=1 Tax=Kitasatospora sp. NPDC085464 TaxID=3364063 RepID=UPI0037C72466
LTLNEDQDDQTIARWVTVGPPFSGQFSPVGERSDRAGRSHQRVAVTSTFETRPRACPADHA